MGGARHHTLVMAVLHASGLFPRPEVVGGSKEQQKKTRLPRDTSNETSSSVNQCRMSSSTTHPSERLQIVGVGFMHYKS